MILKLLYNPVGNHLIYVFYYEFRCYFEFIFILLLFLLRVLTKKVIITKFVIGTYEPQKITYECM
jgi:hypothetical protein